MGRMVGSFRLLVHLNCEAECSTLMLIGAAKQLGWPRRATLPVVRLLHRPAEAGQEGQRAVETPPRPRAKSASTVDLVGQAFSLRGKGCSGVCPASGFDGIRRDRRRLLGRPDRGTG